MSCKPCLRRAEVLRIIEERGFKRHDFEKLLAAGVLTRVKVTPASYAYYLRTEIERHFQMNANHETPRQTTP